MADLAWRRDTAAALAELVRPDAVPVAAGSVGADDQRLCGPLQRTRNAVRVTPDPARLALPVRQADRSGIV